MNNAYRVQASYKLSVIHAHQIFVIQVFCCCKVTMLFTSQLPWLHQLPTSQLPWLH